MKRKISQQWIPLEAASSKVQKLLSGKWKWYWNSRFKYIQIRIDTRDGKCIFTDRDGNVVSFDEIEAQHKPANY